jgi:hypothetical protein
MATTQHEADIINKERQRMADQMTEKLKKLSVDVRVAHYTGDSSYPTEYTISYQDITETGPTFDLALIAWIAKLIEVSRQPASSYLAMEKGFNALAHGLSALHTDVLDIKTAVVQDSEEK